jgi:hypothetical protein
MQPEAVFGASRANGSNDKLEGTISGSFFRTEAVSSEPQVDEVEIVEQSAIDERRIKSPFAVSPGM